MKKKVISFIGLLLFVGVVAFNMHVVDSSDHTSEVTLENIEALASWSCIGDNFTITPIPGGWRCETPGDSCCPVPN